MSIIAWIVLGLGAGLLATIAIAGRRSQGLVITCVIGIAWALLGGWLANVHAAGTVLTLAGALGLPLSLRAGGLLNPARRSRASDRSHDSGTPVLVRAEKSTSARTSCRYDTRRTSRDAMSAHGS